MIHFQTVNIKKTVYNSKIKELFKDFKFTDINIVLTNTIEWFKKTIQIILGYN